MPLINAVDYRTAEDYRDAQPTEPPMTDRLTPGSPLPPTLGACVDFYAEVRELRLAMEKQVAEVAQREAEVKDHLINSLAKGEDSGTAGQKFRGHITSKPKPKIADWAAFTAHVAKTGQFDLMQKRTTDTAVLDRWEAGETVPGIERMMVPTLSVTKIPGR